MEGINPGQIIDDYCGCSWCHYRDHSRSSKLCFLSLRLVGIANQSNLKIPKCICIFSVTALAWMHSRFAFFNKWIFENRWVCSFQIAFETCSVLASMIQMNSDFVAQKLVNRGNTLDVQGTVNIATDLKSLSALKYLDMRSIWRSSIRSGLDLAGSILIRIYIWMHFSQKKKNRFGVLKNKANGTYSRIGSDHWMQIGSTPCAQRVHLESVNVCPSWLGLSALILGIWNCVVSPRRLTQRVFDSVAFDSK